MIVIGQKLKHAHVAYSFDEFRSSYDWACLFCSKGKNDEIKANINASCHLPKTITLRNPVFFF